MSFLTSCLNILFVQVHTIINIGGATHESKQTKQHPSQKLDSVAEIKLRH